MTTASEFSVRIRDKFLNQVGEIDDYSKLDIKLRYNDVSTWQLTFNRAHPMATYLTDTGAGIIVRREGSSTPIISGPWVEMEDSSDGDLDHITLSGVSDLVWLQRRLAYPDPSDIVPPYPVLEDLETGTASTVLRYFVNENAATAAEPARQVFGLAAGADPVVGPSVTVAGRWQNLLQISQEIANTSEAQGTPLGFTAYQTVFLGNNTISFFVFPSVDLSDSIKFSRDLNNLAAYSYKRTAPTCNYAIVGGDGEGTARTFYEKPQSQSIADWGRIEEDLTDARNGSTTVELSQSADTALTEGASTTSLSITPIDTDTQKFGIHYTLGNKVSVLLSPIGGADDQATPVQIKDIVREVSISLTPDETKIVPSIGTQGMKVHTTRLFRSVRKLKGRMTNLERR